MNNQAEKLWPSSKNVHRTSYNSEEQVLEVEFKNKKTYCYSGFSPEKWEELLKAESIGKYVQSELVGKYKTTLKTV